MAPKRDRRPALTEGYPAVQLARLQRRYSACLAPRRRSSSDHRSFRKSRSGKTAVQGFVKSTYGKNVSMDMPHKRANLKVKETHKCKRLGDPSNG